MAIRLRLFAKYAALIVALVGGALVASGAISLYFAYGESRQALLALQREKADAAAYRIEQYVRGLEHEIGWTALPRVQEGSSASEQRRIEFLKLLRQAPQITEAVWIDRHGDEQVRVSRLAMDALAASTNLKSDPRVVGSQDGRTYFGPVTFRKDTEPYMAIARAVGGQDGGTTAVEVNLKFVWDVVSQLRIGKAGIAYVVDADGHLVAHPDISLVLQKLDWTKQPQVIAAWAVPGADGAGAGAPGAGDAGGVLAGEAGSRQLEVRTRDGKPVLVAYAAIPSLDWRVFVEVPREEVLIPVFASMYRTGAVLLVGLILSVLASVFMARRMVRPIRALQEGAAQIGSGNLQQEIVVKTGDELEALADQFNTMAVELKESYSGLERKVDERTRELSATLEQQTATSGILRVISNSPTNEQPVFDAIVASAIRLFDGHRIGLILVENGQLHMRARGSLDAIDEEALNRLYPMPLNRDSFAGQAILDSEMLQIADVDAPGHLANAVAQAHKLGYRSTSIAPLLREGVAIGAIAVPRAQPGVMSDKQIALLQTFADQAVIAIENVRLFREIETKNRQLEIASKHKSEFLANMSHELRTPLNAIIGFSEVLGERMFGELNDKQAEYADDIHTSGKHLLSLINDILDLAKVEAGRMELNLSDYNLPAAIDNAMTLIRERALRHGLQLTAEIDAAVGDLRGDERKVKQILLNLLSNAVKFTPEGGKVTVRAHYADGFAHIAVVDTGVGIAPEDHAAVFEEFKQVGTDVTKKGEGTGLGLALTKSFVELHGGRLWLESAIGEGSTFTFTLPLELPAAVQSDRAAQVVRR